MTVDGSRGRLSADPREPGPLRDTRVRVIVVLLAFSLSPLGLQAQQRWFRGNTHVHTVNSDGDSSPDTVVRWYREHGYHFVALTDHDLRTPVEGLNAVYGAPAQFLVLGGVEVTDRLGNRPVHVTGLGVHQTVLPQGGATVPEVLDRDGLAVAGAGGLPIINHPNGLLRAALSATEMGAARVPRHFEVCCADYRGGSGHPSTEELWDAMLSRGRLMYGVAADHAHSFQPGSRDPGSAWIMVRASSLSAQSLLDALRSGEFYATTGALLDDITSNDQRVCLNLADTDDYGFRTIFIGDGGRVLAQQESPAPCYAFQPDDRYVRARVLRSDGAEAWTQPAFVERR